MKKFVTCALVGILMACAVVPVSAAPVVSPQATIVVEGDSNSNAGSSGSGSSSSGSSNSDTSNKSPQTGDFNAAPFVVATLSMAAAAVACKVVKTSKEQ
ncbi:MAG: hypothetical protein UH080_01860 [Ruminococcus sp.]|nr:hypothetical protein [Ruminococcus sp.]